MLKVLAGNRQSGRTTKLIELTLQHLRDHRHLSLMFPTELSANNFSRMLLIAMLGKPVEHNIETRDVVRMLETLGYRVNVYLLFSLRNVLRNSHKDELVVCDDWRCRGDAEFKETVHLSKGRRVLTAVEMDAYRSLSSENREHSSVVVLDLQGKTHGSSDGPLPTVGHTQSGQ